MLMAPTKDVVLLKRAEFFDSYLHAPQRAPVAAKRLAAEGAVPEAHRARRSSAPSDLAPDRIIARRGPLPGEGRAGPGRSHAFELTAPVSPPRAGRGGGLCRPAQQLARGAARSRRSARSSSVSRTACGEQASRSCSPVRGARAGIIDLHPLWHRGARGSTASARAGRGARRLSRLR